MEGGREEFDQLWDDFNDHVVLSFDLPFSFILVDKWEINGVLL